MPFVQIGERRIFYSAHGKRGLPIVLIHGAAGNHLVWSLQVRALGDVGRVIALDLPGHGRSDPPGCDTLHAYCDLVLGVLDALQFERAVIVGHSMGGAIAQTLALTHPGRVSGLGLIGTGARLRVHPDILAGILTHPDEIAAYVIAYSYTAITPELRRRAEAEFRACPPSIAHGDFIACNQFDALACVSQIAAPTLVLCGKQDRMTPPKFSVYLAKQIPNAVLVLVDEAGHSVMLEQPEPVNAALGDWVKRL